VDDILQTALLIFSVIGVLTMLFCVVVAAGLILDKIRERKEAKSVRKEDQLLLMEINEARRRNGLRPIESRHWEDGS
jgi:hypothetical protein